MASKAAGTIVHGHFKIYVNDTSLLQEVLLGLGFALVRVADHTIGTVATVADNVQQLIAGSLDMHCGSLKDAIFHAKGCIKAPTAQKLQ